MTDWKQKIEAQIAALRKAAKLNAAFKERAYDKFGMGNKPQHESEWQIADQLQALLDVVVAADQLFNELAHYGHESADSMNAISAALDKLQEISDD